MIGTFIAASLSRIHSSMVRKSRGKSMPSEWCGWWVALSRLPHGGGGAEVVGSSYGNMGFFGTTGASLSIDAPIDLQPFRRPHPIGMCQASHTPGRNIRSFPPTISPRRYRSSPVSRGVFRRPVAALEASWTGLGLRRAITARDTDPGQNAARATWQRRSARFVMAPSIGHAFRPAANEARRP